MKDFYKEIGNKDENQLITEEYAKKIITESQTQNKQHNNEQPKQLKLSNIVKIEDKKIVNDPNDTKLTNVIFQSFAGRFALVNDGGDWVLFYLKTLQTAHQIYFIKHTNMQSLIGLPLNDKCTFIIMCYEEKGNYSFILGTKKEIINAQTTTQPTCLTLVGNDTFLYVADNNKKIKIVGNLSSQFKDGVLLDLSDNKQQTILAITNVTLNNPMFSDCLNEQWEITKDFGEITYLTHQVEIVKVVVQQTAKYEKTGNTFFNYSFTPTFSLNAKVKSADKKDQLKILKQNESAMIAKTFTTKNNETFILIVAKNEKNEHFIYKIDPTNLQNKQKMIINDSNRSISDIKQIEIFKILSPLDFIKPKWDSSYFG